MKSLLYKEYCLLKRNWSLLFILLFMAIGLINSLFMNELRFVWCCVAVILFSAIPTALLNQDEIAGWRIFSEILPLKKTEVVLGKYLIGAIGWICSAAYIGLIVLIGYFRFPESFELKELIALLNISVLGMASVAVALPFSHRFGASYGVVAQIGYIGFVSGFCAAWPRALERFGDFKVMVALFVFAILLYMISAYISVKIYKKYGAK